MMATLTLPGLADVHTHLRVPGGEHKEDFSTGTAAALAGGVTTVLAMPNTTPPLTSPEVLQSTRQKAQGAIYSDVGLFAGASPPTADRLALLAPYAVGLKIYLNDTFGPLRVEDLSTLLTCFKVWPADKIIAIHAEGQSVAVGLGLAAAFQRPVHFCHISRREEIELIATAKQQGFPITCEVTPHHLFLSESDLPRLGSLGDMRPRLAATADVAALWAHLDTTIDCVATDHAPHTLAEKNSASPPPGVPGLETWLPLMLTAVHEKRLSLERLVKLMSTNPRRIFNLPPQPDTWVEVDSQASYNLSNEGLHTKCGWTPFAGMKVIGRVHRVFLRGQLVFADGRVMAQGGSGQLIP
jgi:carbamoyl-phosphate synthase/aspartate carbamoyltransferase/dihydroorotase